MPPRLPPLNALRAFEAAARLLSFKKAALELAVTPAAISHQIKLLEEFLDLALFRRLTRALELTPAGAAMLPRVQEGFACLLAAVEATRRKETGGIVTLCAPPSFAARWLVPRLGHFARAHPDIDLRLSSSVSMIDKRDKAADGAAGPTAEEQGYDLTIRFGRGQYAGCTVDRLFSPVYVPVCSPALSDGQHPLRIPADLRWHTLIHDATVPELDDRPGWSQWLELAGVDEVNEPTRAAHFQDGALALSAALAGQGVALAALPMVSADIADGRLVMPFALSIPSRYAYFASTPAATAERPTVLALRTWLVREAARERAAEGSLQATGQPAEKSRQGPRPVVSPGGQRRKRTGER
jgi:LysR family transcriptional regulator, glycine cleavage system transcriptional activator